MSEANNAWRGVLMALGFVGTLIFFVGLILTLAGGHVVLPGLGLVVGGEVVLLAGVLIVAGAVVADARLSQQRLP